MSPAATSPWAKYEFPSAGGFFGGRGNMPARCEGGQDLFDTLFYGLPFGMTDDFGGYRRFVGVVDACEALDLASPRLCVHGLDVAGFAHLKRRVDEDFDEALRVLAHLAAHGTVGADVSRDGDYAVAAQKVGYES